MHKRNPFSNMDTAANYSIFSPNKTQNPELDDKSFKVVVIIITLLYCPPIASLLAQAQSGHIICYHRPTLKLS